MYTYKVRMHPNNKQATKIRRTLCKYKIEYMYVIVVI